MLNMRPFPRDYQPLGLAIAPDSAADRDKLVDALQHITREDPSCAPLIDADSGLVRLPVKSEAHIAAILEALLAKGVSAKAGVPQVSYREMPTVTAEVDYTHAYRSDTSAEFAQVRLRFEHNPRSMNNTFLNTAPPEAVPPHFLPGIEKGLLSVTACGPLKGYPVVACRVTLLDGAWREGESTPEAFEVAARAAFLDAGPKTEMKLFEPMLQTEITTPKEHAAEVLADFKLRRGVTNSKEAAGIVTFAGFAPLATMLGYTAHLAAIAGPTAAYDWKLAGLEEVRPNIS